VHDGSPPDAKVAFFGALFAARTDVYRSGSTTRVPANMDGFRYPGYLPFPDAPISSAPHPDALGSPVWR